MYKLLYIFDFVYQFIYKSDMPKQWIELVISVDYHPCDPGSTRWYQEQTVYPEKDLQAGKVIRYKDPGDLFGRITLREMGDEGVTVEYDGHQYILNMRRHMVQLDEGGRDYTEFELWLFLVPADGVEVEEEAEMEDDDGRWDAFV